MPLDQLHTVFQAIILSRLTCSMPSQCVGDPYLNVELKQIRTDAFLKTSFYYGFSKQSYEIDSTMHDLFKAPNHCVFHLLLPRRPLRPGK